MNEGTSAKAGAEGRRNDLLRALLLYLLTRAALAVFVWLTGQHYNCGNAGCLDRGFFPKNFLINGLFQWDAFQYRQLVERGYYLGVEYDTTAPYFPGFPLAAWAAGKLTGSPLWGGIVINHMASIAAAFGIARLARRLRVGAPGQSDAVAHEAILFWLASPLTLFFCVYLSESLFGFLSVAVLWSVASGRWGWALLAGILATATRNAGMIVFAAALVLAWERRKEIEVSARGWVLLTLMPLGLVAFSLYQQHALGDPFAWVETQKRWNRYLTFPWTTIADEWRGWPGVRGRNVQAMYKVQELMALVLPAPLFAVWRALNIPWAILLLGVAEWILPTTSHSLMSAARYQAVNLYFALAIPAFLVRHPTARGLCWMLFGMVLAWYASTYPFGVWAS